MKDKIVDIEGKKFLTNFFDNSFLEIVDYNEPKINTLRLTRQTRGSQNSASVTF